MAFIVAIVVCFQPMLVTFGYAVKCGVWIVWLLKRNATTRCAAWSLTSSPRQAFVHPLLSQRLLVRLYFVPFQMPCKAILERQVESAFHKQDRANDALAS